ncbi:MAG: tetratricopeptide repeat protein [Deltaproteobacteria bacterium]|nr:tetratricopeptide repeat protein [Deltaproteobacteria bacterium]
MSSINEALNKARKAKETADKSYALPLSRVSDKTKPVKRKGSVLILGTILGLGVVALGIIRYGPHLPLDYFNFWRPVQVSRTSPGGQAAAPTRIQAAPSSSSASEPRSVTSASDATGSPVQAPGSVQPDGFQMVSSAPEKQDTDPLAGQPQENAPETVAALPGQGLSTRNQLPASGGAAIDGRANVPVSSGLDATGHEASKRDTKPAPASKTGAPSGVTSGEPLTAGLPATAASGKDIRRSASRSAVPAGTQLYNKAVDLEAKGETRQAQFLYRQAVAVDPTLHQALVNLANLVFVNQHDHHQAIELYRRALKLESKNPRVHNNLGIVYLKQGDIDAAKMEFDQAITLNPGYADAYYNSACLAVQQRDLREGMSLLQKAASLDPEVARSARNDPDLKPLRELPEFKTVVNPTR